MKTKLILVPIVSFLFFFLSYPSYSYAWDSSDGKCTNLTFTSDHMDPDGNIYSDSTWISWRVTLRDINLKYHFYTDGGVNLLGISNYHFYLDPPIPTEGYGAVIHKDQYNRPFYTLANIRHLEPHRFTINRVESDGSQYTYCDANPAYWVVNPPEISPTPTLPPQTPYPSECSIEIQSDEIGGKKLTLANNLWAEVKVKPNILFRNPYLSNISGSLPNEYIRVTKTMGETRDEHLRSKYGAEPTRPPPPTELEYKTNTFHLDDGDYVATLGESRLVVLTDGVSNIESYLRCSTPIFHIRPEGGSVDVPTPTPNCSGCTVSDCAPGSIVRCNSCSVCNPTPIPPTPTPQHYYLSDLCDNIANPTTQHDDNEKCRVCVNPPIPPTGPPGASPVPTGYGGIWTAIGCVPTDVPSILNLYVLGPPGLGIAGGIAFLFFLYGAFLVLTSMGNAEQITNGKEIMMSSIWGMLLILSSIFLLKVVAVDVIRIPGFGPAPTPGS